MTGDATPATQPPPDPSSARGLTEPVAEGLMAHLDPAQRHDLAQVAQGQPEVPPAEHHEGDDVAGQAGAVQHAAAALVELPPAGPAAEAAIILCRKLRPLGHGRRATAHAVQSNSPSVSAGGDATSATQELPDRSLARVPTEPSMATQPELLLSGFSRVFGSI